MTELIKFKSGEIQKMSSVEVAQITGKLHSNVMVDIRTIISQVGDEAGELVFQLANYEDQQGKKRPMYNLTKKGVMLLASGYNAFIRLKLIERLEELEAGVLPTNYIEALKMLIQSEEQKQHMIVQNNELNAKIEADSPKVVFADSVIGSSNSILVRQFAKDLCDGGFDIGEKRLYRWLRENKYLNSNNEPYQEFIGAGYFEVITRSIGSGEETFTTRTTKITGRGAVYFAKKIKETYKSE